MRKLLKRIDAAPATLPATGDTPRSRAWQIGLGGGLALAGVLMLLKHKRAGDRAVP
jgi:hypothetical protein